MPDEKNVKAGDVELVEEAKKYLSGNREYSKSFETVYRKLFESIQEIIDELTESTSTVDFTKLEKIVSKSGELVSDAIKGYSASDEPPFEYLKTVIHKNITDQLSGSPTPKEKVKTPSTPVPAVVRPEELKDHPEKNLDLILQAKAENAVGNNDDAVLKLFTEYGGFKAKNSFIGKVLQRFMLPYMYSPEAAGKKTEQRGKIPGIDSLEDLQIESFEPFLDALRKYEPIYNGQPLRFSTVLHTYVEQFFMNKYKEYLTQKRSPIVEEMVDTEGHEEVVRGQGDIDHLSKYVSPSGKEKEKYIVKVNFITDVTGKPRHKYKEDTDFIVDSPDGIQWVEGGSAPFAGDKYIVDFIYSKEKRSIAKPVSLTDTQSSSSSRDEDEEGNALINKIKDNIMEMPDWQYEFKELQEKIKERLNEISGGRENVMTAYEILLNGGFSLEAKDEIKAKYNVGDSTITDWLKRFIYPAVLEVMKRRSKSTPPGAPVPDTELRSLKLKSPHESPKDESVSEEEEEKVVGPIELE